MGGRVVFLEVIQNLPLRVDVKLPQVLAGLHPTDHRQPTLPGRSIRDNEVQGVTAAAVRADEDDTRRIDERLHAWCSDGRAGKEGDNCQRNNTHHPTMTATRWQALLR